MKLTIDQVNERIKKNPVPIYLISGEETLLVEETCATIRQAAKERFGITDRQTWHVDGNFSWQHLMDSAYNLSLFAEKILIELRFGENKIPAEGQKTLTEYAANPPQDKILILITSKLDTASQNTKWFKAVTQVADFIPIWPITAQQLPQWIRQRLQSNGIQAEPEAIKLIADYVEGNLLAAKQEIEKLNLLGIKNLTVQDAANYIEQQARYDVFTLVDSAISGETKRALQILDNLQQEGVEPVLILWALAREIRQLAAMQEDLSLGKNIDEVLLANKVWEKRKPLIRQCLQRNTKKKIVRLLPRAAKIDRIIKGIEVGNVWDELGRIIINC